MTIFLWTAVVMVAQELKNRERLTPALMVQTSSRVGYYDSTASTSVTTPVMPKMIAAP
jgi:hypothetical protein